MRSGIGGDDDACGCEAYCGVVGSGDTGSATGEDAVPAGGRDEADDAAGSRRSGSTCTECGTGLEYGDVVTGK